MIIKENRTKFQFFPYHLVTTSPWPILVSFSLLSLTIGAVMYMHGYYKGAMLLSIGLALTVTGMMFWFRDVITEGTKLGDHTKEVVVGLFYGIILFIVSEVFAFLSVFWAYGHASLSPAIEIGGSWPPMGITPLNPFAIPLLNTFLLLSSGASITYGHHALISGNRKAAIEGTVITIVFAVVFTALQGFEYNQAPFTIADGAFGSAFFVSTGLHGSMRSLSTDSHNLKNKRILASDRYSFSNICEKEDDLVLWDRNGESFRLDRVFQSRSSDSLGSLMLKVTSLSL